MSAAQVVAAAAAAGLVGVLLRSGRRIPRERLLAGVVATVALAAYASGLLSRLPSPERVIEEVAQTLGPYTYVFVGAMAFLETGAFVGLVAPGEASVVIGGVVAGQGEIDVVPLIGLVWLACILGDTTSFLFGRRLGRTFMLRHGRRLKITPERLERVEGYFERHGGATVLVGRFIGLVRAVAPFIAGSSGMPYGRFLPYSVIGTGLWGTTYCLLGFFFYRSFSQVTEIAGQATLAFGLVVGTAVGAVLAYRRLRHERERQRLARWLERQGRRPLLRPAAAVARRVAAVARPVWRRALRPLWGRIRPLLGFVADRLGPGPLGLEFTSVLAVTLVGLYVFGLYSVILSGGTRLTPADQTLLDLAGQLRLDGVTDVLRLLTDLASLPVAAGLVTLASLLLAMHRRPIEAVSLVAGLAAVWVSVQLTKAGVDRPRPVGALIETRGASFPSGHAAYSTAFVAIALTLSRALPGLFRRAAMVIAALVLVALAGLSRLYLGAHFWSDVAGGWGLGFGLFGACAAVALIVLDVRQNERPAPRLEEGRAATGSSG